MSLDKEMQGIVDRAIRDIERTPLQIPKEGEMVSRCHWSRTGWAIYNTSGCTCRPAKEPVSRQ